MKTFNKKGDSGETSLLYGDRVSKSDARCEAYGTIDEAVSMVGLARQFCQPKVKEIILSVQQELFIIGAELATPAEHYSKLVASGDVITQEMVQRLENMIDEFEAKIRMPTAFIIPGRAGTGSAALDVARAVIRRAERRIVSLKQSGIAVNEEILKYINRLADLLFTLARYQEAQEQER